MSYLHTRLESSDENMGLFMTFVVDLLKDRYNHFGFSPQNDTEQSIHETEAHSRHRLACASTWFFLSDSEQPSHEKKTILEYCHGLPGTSTTGLG